MKQKLRQIFKISLFTASLFVLSCNDDEQVNYQTQNQKHLIVKEISFEELLKQDAFFEAYGKVTKKMQKKGSLINARTALEDEYDFTIGDAPAKVIETHDQTSYTMLIIRDIENAAYYENLTINVNKQTGSTNAYVVKYVPNSAPFNTADNSYSFDAAIQMTQIFFNSSSENKMGNGCIRWSIWLCDNDGHGGTGPIHVAEANCTSAYVMSGESCIDAAGNGGSSGGPVSPGGGNSSGPSVPGSGPIGGQSGGGGGNSGNNPPYNPNLPVITTPIFQETPAGDPCVILKGATDNAGVMVGINELKSKTTGNYEFSYEIERRLNLETDSFNYIATCIEGEGMTVSVSVGDYIQGQAHNHPINGIPIPSWGDIAWTEEAEGVNSPNNNGTAFNIVIVPDPASAGNSILYAVTIDNFVSLQEAIALEYNEPDIKAELNQAKKTEKVNAKFQRDFVSIQTNTVALEKKFLEVFANYGITLSKFNNQTGKWEKLKLQNPYNPSDPNATNTIIQQPCN